MDARIRIEIGIEFLGLVSVIFMFLLSFLLFIILFFLF